MVGGVGDYVVRVRHDAEVGVWYVESSDIPGLSVETPTFEALVEVVTDVAPDLIGHYLRAGAARLSIICHPRA